MCVDRSLVLKPNVSRYESKLQFSRDLSGNKSVAIVGHIRTFLDVRLRINFESYLTNIFISANNIINYRIYIYIYIYITTRRRWLQSLIKNLNLELLSFFTPKHVLHFSILTFTEVDSQC